MKMIKWLLSLAPKTKKYLIIGITFCILNSLLSIATPLLIAKSIDNAVSNIHVKVSIAPKYQCDEYNTCLIIPTPITTYIPKPVLPYLFSAVIIFILCAILDYFQNLFMYRLATTITFTLRQKVNSKIFSLPTIQYGNSTKGEITSLVVNDIEAINSSLASDLSESISSIILFIGTLIAMLTISFKLSLIIIVTVPILFIFLAIILSKGEKHFKSYQEELAKYNSFIEESYSGFQTIKHHNATEIFQNTLTNYTKELNKSSKLSQFLSSLMYPFTNLISRLTFVITCLYGSLSLLSGKMSLGTLEAFLSYAKNINEPLLNLSSLTTTFETINSASTRLKQLIDLPNEKTKSLTNYNLKGNIVFQNITFSYGHQNVLNNISFNIKAGQKIAIVGATGSGKSTLVKLLLQFYEPSSGTITIDNIPLSNIHPHNLRTNIAYIPQDLFLATATIKDNILFNQNTNKYEEALKLITIPDDYYYDSEQNSLSIGEIQLVTIARALIKDAPIIILDEATSNLDTHTESKITNALANIIQNKTSIIIAHHLTTIKKCDQIIVLKDGHIVEIGTHQELLKNKSHYYHLYKDN